MRECTSEGVYVSVRECVCDENNAFVRESSVTLCVWDRVCVCGRGNVCVRENWCVGEGVCVCEGERMCVGDSLCAWAGVSICGRERRGGFE